MDDPAYPSDSHCSHKSIYYLYYHKIVQNKVAKAKMQNKHTKRIKNLIGTWGRKSHPGPLERFAKHVYLWRINKNYFTSIYLSYIFTHVHIYDLCYYRKCLKFLSDALKRALYRSCANRRTFLNITRFKTQVLKYILLQQEFFLLSLPTMKQVFHK